MHIGRRTIAKYIVAPARTIVARQRSSKLDPVKPIHLIRIAFIRPRLSCSKNSVRPSEVW
jgi:hypothetical protein